MYNNVYLSHVDLLARKCVNKKKNLPVVAIFLCGQENVDVILDLDCP